MKYLFNKKVPMRDGVDLSADIYLPDSEPPYPVLLVRTPYDSSSERRVSYAQFYVNQGYCVITQDVRGRGDSDGIFIPFVNEQNDGYDTIKWIVEQPWCLNRSVAMIAGSYHGSAQWAVAQTGIPELKAICPAVCGSNLFKDTLFTNGILNSLGVHWPREISGRTTQGLGVPLNTEAIMNALPLHDMDKSAGYDVPSFQEWLLHPVYDDYWKRLSVEEHCHGIGIPVLIIGGWYDLLAAGCVTNYMLINKHGSEYVKRSSQLIMGPWNHVTFDISSSRLGCIDFGRGRLYDTKEAQAKWLARCFSGKSDHAAGAEAAPVYIFIMGANVWRAEREWPLQRTQYRDLFLSSRGRANSLLGDGELTWELETNAGQDVYAYDPANPTPSINPQLLDGMPEDQRPVERRDDVLVFTSGTLSEALEITGFIKLTLYISSSAADTDFAAKLCDVHPDGRSINLCEGIVRTRFREGLEQETLMTPGNVYRLTIELGVTANLFLPGHKIRLEIASASFPSYSRNLNTGEPVATGITMQIAKQTVYHSDQYPSKLTLPVIASATLM